MWKTGEYYKITRVCIVERDVLTNNIGRATPRVSTDCKVYKLLSTQSIQDYLLLTFDNITLKEKWGELTQFDDLYNKIEITCTHLNEDN